MKYKYLLFDADNTLFDFGMAEYHAFMETCSHAGIQWSEEAYRVYSEINDAQWKKLERGETTQAELKIQRYREFLQWYGYSGDRETMAVCMGNDYKEALGRQIYLMPDALDVLKALTAKGYWIGIVTNGITAIQTARLAASPMRKYIRKLYISEEMGCAKPDPAFFEAVFTDLQVSDPSQYLVIGDSLSSDIDGASAAGIDSVWFCPEGSDAKGRTPAYTIHELKMLLAIL